MYEIKVYLAFLLLLMLPLLFDGFAVAYQIKSPENENNLILVQTVSQFMLFHMVVVFVV